MSRSLKRNLCLLTAVISSVAAALCVFSGDWVAVAFWASSTCTFAFLAGALIP